LCEAAIGASPPVGGKGLSAAGNSRQARLLFQKSDANGGSKKSFAPQSGHA